MKTDFDLIIAGGGPIGASTAYFLSLQKKPLRVAVITDDSEDEGPVTYKNAGGSIRWFWDDDLRREMTWQTAEFVKGLLRDGVDLAALEDTYHFVYRGVFAPSLNVRGALLVNYFLDQAGQNGVTIHRSARIQKVASKRNLHTVETSRGSFTAPKVLLAMGVGNEKFMPGLKLEHEKRQLFVTDLPVPEERQFLPHTIVPVGDGYGYVFIKKFPNGLKLVVGQEDIIDDTDETQPVDYYTRLMDAGLGNIMPYLREAHVEKILWGIDADNKTLRLEDNGKGLYAANCGSAIRGCVHIGKHIANSLNAA